MYRVDKEKVRNIGIQLLIIILSCFFGILGYIIYLDSQIYVYEKSAFGTKLLRDIEEKEVENSENLIEEATKSVVGISKLKDNGTSIFLENSVEDLGLGTGVIITENRIYIDKSTCCWG